MSFLLLLLLALLPVLLSWVLSLIKNRQQMTLDEAGRFRDEMAKYASWLNELEDADNRGELNDRQKKKLKKALDIYCQIKANSKQAGCEIK